MADFSTIILGCAFLGVGGCGGHLAEEPQQPVDAALNDTHHAQLDSASPNDVAAEQGADVAPETPDRDCSRLEDAISALATEAVCTAVVRLSYSTMETLGWQIACSSSAPGATEADARRAFTPYVPPRTALDQYAVKPSGATDPWVLFKHPYGFYGGVALVSKQTGELLFAGGSDQPSVGVVTFPSAWRPAAELGAECKSSPAPEGGTFIGAEEMKDSSRDAIKAVWKTAVPRGLAEMRSLRAPWVLGYAPKVTLMNPALAQWVVVLQSVR